MLRVSVWLLGRRLGRDPVLVPLRALVLSIHRLAVVNWGLERALLELHGLAVSVLVEGLTVVAPDFFLSRGQVHFLLAAHVRESEVLFKHELLHLTVNRDGWV